MKILADESVMLAEEVFSQFGSVTLKPGRDITAEDVADKDILIVRSVTNVDEKLLHKSDVKFVGTATIGTDHIDIDYLADRKIKFAYAPGCNSYGVAEYFLAALMHHINKKNLKLENLSVGIIGRGNVGSKVSHICDAIGLKTVINDPPLERMSDEQIYYPLEKALACDIVTLHVPLKMEGEDRTYHLINDSNLNLLKENSLLINTSRGSVINNKDLLNLKKKRNDINVVLDVWENEPYIDKDLQEIILLGTGHIAGYTFEGKLNGTKMIFYELNNYLEKKFLWKKEHDMKANILLNIKVTSKREAVFKKIIDAIYDIKQDSNNFNSYLSNGTNIGKSFDQYRKNYTLRREFLNYIVSSEESDQSIINILKNLRFRVNR